MINVNCIGYEIYLTRFINSSHWVFKFYLKKKAIRRFWVTLY